jgi:hypothetical protein
MHASNPYGAQIDYGYYEANIQRLLKDPNLYLVHMNEERDDKVHHYIFEPSSQMGETLSTSHSS